MTTTSHSRSAVPAKVAAVGAGAVPDAGRLTVGAYFDQWLAGHVPSLKPSTAKSYREVVQWYVQPALGRVKLVDLNALLIRSLYADLLVRAGIDAISVNVDVIDRTRSLVAAAERRVLLDAARP